MSNVQNSTYFHVRFVNAKRTIFVVMTCDEKQRNVSA